MSTYNPNNSRRLAFAEAQRAARHQDTVARHRMQQRKRFGRYLLLEDYYRRLDKHPKSR